MGMVSPGRAGVGGRGKADGEHDVSEKWHTALRLEHDRGCLREVKGQSAEGLSTPRNLKVSHVK